jgi:peptidoglycan hydrolase FlgJ
MKIGSDVEIQPPMSDVMRHARLTNAAQQFEATMLQELLRPMQHGQGSRGEDESSDSSNDTMSSFGAEAVAKAISQRGGFGLAKLIISKVTVEEEKNSTKKMS